MSDPINVDDATGGLDRRSLIKRGAVVGGALVWTAPIVQAVAGPAFGAVPSGGTTGTPVCVSGTVLAFKNERGPDMSTTGTLQDNTNGFCEDPTADGVSTVTTNSAIVSISYADGNAPGTNLTRVVITLAPGYVLGSVRTKSANEGSPSGPPCPAAFLNPAPSNPTSVTGFTYVIEAALMNSISHVTGTIRCV